MNGAPAKLWRELEDVTGGNGDTFLQLVAPRSANRDKSSNTDREDNSTIVVGPKTN